MFERFVALVAVQVAPLTRRVSGIVKLSKDTNVLLDVLKIDAIAAFASQTQITALVAAQRAGGPVEHLKLVTWKGYDVSETTKLFALVTNEADNGYARDCRRTEQFVAAWSATPWAPLVEWITEARTTPVLFLTSGNSGR